MEFLSTIRTQKVIRKQEKDSRIENQHLELEIKELIKWKMWRLV